MRPSRGGHAHATEGTIPCYSERRTMLLRCERLEPPMSQMGQQRLTATQPCCPLRPNERTRPSLKDHRENLESYPLLYSALATASSAARSAILITRFSIRMEPLRCHSWRHLLTLSRDAPTRLASSYCDSRNSVRFAV